MYTLVRTTRPRDALLVEAPSFTLALIVAEVFYKFRSFSLECVCFLATWLAFSAALSFVTRRRPSNPSASS